MALTTARSKSSLWLHLAFAVILVTNFMFWMKSRTILPEWDNVPPPPKSSSARLVSLGDPEIAYRLFGYFLQSLGNTGGRFESLKSYDYAALEKWFFVADELDQRSNYIPFLAAYYFGTIEGEPERISHVTNYLAKAGMEPYPEKWRWLAHAVFLARHRENNLPRALELANTLAAMPDDLPVWARQMPAFVNEGLGNKQASYEIMARILSTEGEKLHPNEVNFMVYFICQRTLSRAEAAQNPLCRNER